MNLWLIPLLPAAGAVVNGLFGRHFSKRMVWIVGLAFVGAAMLYAWWVAIQFAQLPASAIPRVEDYGTWFLAGSFNVQYGLQLDQLSLLMILIVTGVGFLIHVYSVGYMAEEGGYYRFFSFLNLFMFFMLTLVLANNYLLMFVGWEGVGLCSYLLIGFFFLRDSASAAGKKAFIVNRIGDFGFLIGLFLIIRYFGSVNFGEVFGAAARMPVEGAGAGLLTAIALLLLMGATGKSAQLPLYVWLPDAMEGPTPVSALIHAATMVTAGVYMIARSHVIFERAPVALTVVAVIGCGTALFAATIALVQNDIKRVLAYSTVSQVGYMVMACGVAAFSAAMFHLMTHAFFKALLFLAAGSVIHGLGGEQDLRRMGGLRQSLPWTFWTMTAATLAIAGTPLFSGFFSKDEILARTFSSPYGGWSLWAVGVLTALLTSFYMFRLWFMTFFGEYRGEKPAPHPAAAAMPSHTPYLPGEAGFEVVTPKDYEQLIIDELIRRGGHVEGVEPRGRSVVIRGAVPKKKLLYLEAEILNISDDHARVSIDLQEQPTAPAPAKHAHHGPAHESPRVMLVPLVVLAVLSVVGGWVGVPQIMGGSNHIEHFLGPVFHVEAVPPPAESQSETTEVVLSLAATGAAALGFLLAWLMYYKRRDLPEKLQAQAHAVYTLLSNKYYVDELYGLAFVQPIIDASRQLLWKRIDVGLIDDTVNETAMATRHVSDAFRRMQSGNIRSYAGWVAMGAAAVLAYMVWAGVR